MSNFEKNRTTFSDFKQTKRIKLFVQETFWEVFLFDNLLF